MQGYPGGLSNISDDPAQEFYADGMTGDLITELSKLSGLAVIARHSVFAYKDQPTALGQIARELGVRYVLEGNMRRLEGKIRINVSLIDASNSRSIWSERYDSEQAGLFDLQNQVIGRIVSALAVALTDQEQSLLVTTPTDNLEAYDYYLRAERRRLLGADSDFDEKEVIELYRKAIALDPGFAAAYAGLARQGFDLWSSDASRVMPGAVARKMAYESASKVLELDSSDPAANSVMALLQATDGQHEIAIESSRRAIELGPNSADAWAIRAQVLMYAGQHEQALETITRAIELNPKPPDEFYGLLGRAQFLNERYDDAAVTQVKIRSNYLRFKHELLMSFGQLGQAEQAKATFDAILERIPFANLAYYRITNRHRSQYGSRWRGDPSRPVGSVRIQGHSRPPKALRCDRRNCPGIPHCAHRCPRGDGCAISLGRRCASIKRKPSGTCLVGEPCRRSRVVC